MKRICGVYKIKNKINGKVYIGQSVNINKRWRYHIYTSKNKKGKGYDQYLPRALRKYGEEGFKFEVVKECAQDELDYWEEYFIDKEDSTDRDKGYNIRRKSIATGYFRRKLNKESEYMLKSQLKRTKIPKSTLSKIYGVSVGTINGINNGGTYYDEKEEYPIRKSTDNQLKYELRLKIKNKMVTGEEIKTGVKKEGIKKSENLKGDKVSKIYYCVECGEVVKNHNARKYCSHNCAAKGSRKINIQKNELIEMLEECPNFTDVGKRLGVTGKAIEKRCITYGIESRAEYYSKIYKERKGYTYRVNKMYEDFKRENREGYEYVLNNSGKYYFKRIKEETGVTESVYKMILVKYKLTPKKRLT